MSTSMYLKSDSVARTIFDLSVVIYEFAVENGVLGPTEELEKLNSLVQNEPLTTDTYTTCWEKEELEPGRYFAIGRHYFREFDRHLSSPFASNSLYGAQNYSIDDGVGHSIRYEELGSIEGEEYVEENMECSYCREELRSSQYVFLVYNNLRGDWEKERFFEVRELRAGGEAQFLPANNMYAKCGVFCSKPCMTQFKQDCSGYKDLHHATGLRRSNHPETRDLPHLPTSLPIDRIAQYLTSQEIAKLALVRHPCEETDNQSLESKSDCNSEVSGDMPWEFCTMAALFAITGYIEGLKRKEQWIQSVWNREFKSTAIRYLIDGLVDRENFLYKLADCKSYDLSALETFSSWASRPGFADNPFRPNGLVREINRLMTVIMDAVRFRLPNASRVHHSGRSDRMPSTTFLASGEHSTETRGMKPTSPLTCSTTTATNSPKTSRGSIEIDRWNEALVAKLQGNTSFIQQEFFDALDSYAEAINLMEGPCLTEEELKVKAEILSMMAKCNMCLGEWTSAREIATKAVAIDSKNCNALLQLLKACAHCGEENSDEFRSTLAMLESLGVEPQVLRKARTLSYDSTPSHVLAPATEPVEYISSVAVSPEILRPDVVLQVPRDYPTIQLAVEAAPAGARIELSGGVYSEDVTLSRPVELVGESTCRSAHCIRGKVSIYPSDPIGPVELRGLNITAGIETKAPFTHVKVEQCKVMNLEGAGVLQQGGILKIYSSVIYKSLDGIVCSEGNLHVRGVHISDCRNDGIRSNVHFILENSSIVNIGGHGIKGRNGITKQGTNNIQNSVWDTAPYETMHRLW